jgi:integrase
MDPGQQRKLEKLARAVSNATTFRGLADEYVDKPRRDGRAPATLEKVSWLLSFTTPGLGERPIADIKASEVLAVLKPIETRGNLETARRLRATIGAVFRFAIATARAEAVRPRL